MIGKRELAAQSHVSVVHKRVQKKHARKAHAQSFKSGRQLSLQAGKKGRKQKDGAKNEKMRWSE